MRLNRWIGWMGLALGIVGCTAAPPTVQEVAVTREVVVEVTREVEIEVTREVEVTRAVEVEVTREVEVTVVAIATPEAVVGDPVEVTATPDARAAAAPDATATVPSLATTVSIVQDDPPDAACWSYEQAPLHVGEAGCVQGIVSGVGGSDSAFFINFSPDRDSFYGVSFDWEWEELAGECLRVSGVIGEFRGRPQIIIDDPTTQVRYCNSGDSPPAFPR